MLNFDKETIDTLYQIARSNRAKADIIGLCGVCTLHSFEVITYLIHKVLHSEHQKSCYLFPHHRNRNPFSALKKQRKDLCTKMKNSNLMSLIEGIPQVPQMLHHQSILFNNFIMCIFKGAYSVGYHITTGQNLDNRIELILSQPSITFWIVTLNNAIDTNTPYLHTVPMLVTHGTAFLIPTNIALIDTSFYTGIATYTLNSEEAAYHFFQRTLIEPAINTQTMRKNLNHVSKGRIPSQKDTWSIIWHQIIT